MRRLFTNTNIDFIGVRKFAYGLTAAFFLPGLVLLLVRGLNYSVEFTGGTLMRIRLEQGVTTDIGAIRKGLSDAGLHGAEIQQYGGTLIKTNLCHENEAKLREALASAQKSAVESGQ